METLSIPVQACGWLQTSQQQKHLIAQDTLFNRLSTYQRGNWGKMNLQPVIKKYFDDFLLHIRLCGCFLFLLIHSGGLKFRIIASIPQYFSCHIIFLPLWSYLCFPTSPPTQFINGHRYDATHCCCLEIWNMSFLSLKF